MNKHFNVSHVRHFTLEIILLVLIIFLSFTAPGFFSFGNFFNVLRNVSTQGIIAFGMTMVIISGEIDLSIGSVVAFAGCLCAFIVQMTRDVLGDVFSVVLAIAIVLLFGVLQGLFMGYIRKKYNIPSFIISLALLTILFGFANLVTGGFPIAPYPHWFGFLGSGRVLGVPFPAIIFIVILIIIHFLLNYTVFGRSIYAVGGNIKSARVSGIKIWKIKTQIFVITSTLAAFSGILVSSQILSGNAGTARGWELDVIASVIIGGTSLFGGVGKVWGTFIGVLFLGVMFNGMTLLNINEYWQYVVRGSIILIAVLLNEINRKAVIS